VGFFVCLGEWERGSKPRDAGRLREFGEHVSPPQARGGPGGTTPGDSPRLHHLQGLGSSLGPFPIAFPRGSAGQRCGCSSEINVLRAPVRCQPRRPVEHRTCNTDAMGTYALPYSS
jgi:hypothetical protein